MDYSHVMVRFSLVEISIDDLIDLGCQKTFCSKHSVEHTDELRNRLEEISNQYNSAKDIFDGYKEKFSDVQWKLIDELEREFKEIKGQIDQSRKTSKWLNRDREK